MVVLLATHGALSFMVTPVGWAIQDRSQHLGVDLAVWIVRAFALPMFFWLSGFCSRAVLEGQGVRGFVRHRVTRILLPLVIAIVPCSLALDALWDWGRELAGRPEVAANVPKLQGSGLPITLGHLWYLYYLLALSGIALAVVAVTRRGRLVLPGAAILASVAILACGSLAVTGMLQPDTPLGFALDPGAFAFEGALFAWGWLVHARPGELERYGARAWWFVGIAVASLGAVLPALYDSADPASQARPPLYAIAASGVFALAATGAFIALCVRYARWRHRSLQLASEASYWCYIVHLPLLVLLQISLAEVRLPGVLKFLAIVAVTMVASVLSYALVIRRAPLRRLLG